MGHILMSREESGFTLPEVLISLGIGAFLLSAVIGVFQLQTHIFMTQEQSTEMVQTARAAMDMICREVRMAGYNPTGASFHGLSYLPGKLRILADFRGNHENDPPDGKTDDPHENITYEYAPAKRQITRNTGGGNQPFAENVASFSVVYLDRHGNAATTTASIHQVKITMTVESSRSAKKDSADHGFRSYTLTSLVTPTNIIAQDK